MSGVWEVDGLEVWEWMRLQKHNKRRLDNKSVSGDRDSFLQSPQNQASCLRRRLNPKRSSDGDWSRCWNQHGSLPQMSTSHRKINPNSPSDDPGWNYSFHSPYQIDRKGEKLMPCPSRRAEYKVRSGSSNQKKGNSGTTTAVVFDLDVLECLICLEPLSSQIFQCCNGHYVCQPCIAKMNGKCPTCSEPIGKIRNLGLEKIIESLKVPCEFAHVGCEEMLRYTEKKLHEQNCPLRPHQCPIAECSFHGLVKDFSLHFKELHATRTVNFEYTQWFSVFINRYDHYLLLQEDKDKLFILHSKKENLGNALYVTVLEVHRWSSMPGFRMVVSDGRKTVQLESTVIPSSSSSVKALEHSSTDFLLVPRSFMECNERLRVDLFIFRIGIPFASCR